jgi:2-polyprenyl-3-methyl-5-hydroxy-6-metoxy-1,4-benzoquinol methylase
MSEAASACVVCGKTTRSEVERASVCSNVRAFRHERFSVWRCRSCASLHASETVQLERYYERYPFHDLPADFRLRALYANQLRRLRRAGVERATSVLDYGCGEGAFVRFLRHSGYSCAEGYDPYSTTFADSEVLKRQYDCVVSQDCIEHVESPLALLAQFDVLAKPHGAIVIGTPDANAIDLSDPEAFAHTLHVPFHRHILSQGALIEAGECLGWRLERAYDTMYANTHVPFLNERFYRYYLTLTDDTLDALIEPVQVGKLFARLPQTLAYGFFGSLLSRSTDITLVFRKG